MVVFLKKNSKVSLFSSLVFFVLGIVIFVNQDIIVKTISYGLGGLLILIGVYRSVSYYIHDKNLGVVTENSAVSEDRILNVKNIEKGTGMIIAVATPNGWYIL